MVLPYRFATTDQTPRARGRWLGPAALSTAGIVALIFLLNLS